MISKVFAAPNDPSVTTNGFYEYGTEDSSWFRAFIAPLDAVGRSLHGCLQHSRLSDKGGVIGVKAFDISTLVGWLRDVTGIFAGTNAAQVRLAIPPSPPLYLRCRAHVVVWGLPAAGVQPGLGLVQNPSSVDAAGFGDPVPSTLRCLGVAVSPGGRNSLQPEKSHHLWTYFRFRLCFVSNQRSGTHHADATWMLAAAHCCLCRFCTL